jgi:hypothetical protein
MGPRWRWGLLWRVAAAIARLRWSPRESLVELLLDDSGGAAGLGRPGGSQVVGVDLGGCPPDLQVGDQLGRNESAPDSRPGRRFSCGVVAELVGELSNKL